MGLFTDRVDRFFVGKIVVGGLFIASLFNALRAIFVLAGFPPPARRRIGDSPATALLVYSVLCCVWLVAFRWIEARRIRELGSASVTSRIGTEGGGP